MFWILKRTRLSSGAFFNAINNNLGSGAGSTYLNNRNGNKANVSRKGYNKLSTLMAEDEGEGEEEWAEGGVEGKGKGGEVVVEEQVAPMEEEGDEDEDDEANDSLCYTDYEISDDSDYEESLTCNVCDRYFPTTRLLAQHQQKKRHFGCSACDNLFPSLMALEHHKEELEHWSEEMTDEGSEGRRRRARECSDEEDRDEDALSEEHERLLL